MWLGDKLAWVLFKVELAVSVTRFLKLRLVQAYNTVTQSLLFGRLKRCCT